MMARLIGQGDVVAQLRFFPVSYDVDGRVVLVVGNGQQALQKLRLLVRTKARLRLVGSSPEAELAAFAAQHDIEQIKLGLCPCVISKTALVFIASGDEAQDQKLSALVRACGVPVNVVDRPHLSDFAVPAIVDRAPIAVAISSDGFAPVLAQRVRALIEAALPPHFGRLGALAESVRQAVMTRLHDSSARRKFWAKLFDGEAGRVALVGEAERAQILALRGLEQAVETPEQGIVYLVGAGPGAEDLLTLRAHRLLQNADVIVHDALVPEAVLAMGRRDANRISVGKRKGHHSMAQHEIDALLVRLAGEGHMVVRLKAGDPLVFGRVGEEISALRAAHIPFEIVPGITAALAAAADSHIPLTLRGVASHIVFATGHGADGDEPEGYETLAMSGATIALYMGKSVADRAVKRLIAAGLSPNTPAAAVENAGRSNRRILRGTLEDLPSLVQREDIAGPVLILIGPAVAEGTAQLAEHFAAKLSAAA